MYQDNQDVFYYITLENENYVQPTMPQGVEEGIIRDMYQIKKSSNSKLNIQLLGSGPILNEVISASKLLKDDWGVEWVSE